MPMTTHSPGAAAAVHEAAHVLVQVADGRRLRIVVQVGSCCGGHYAAGGCSAVVAVRGPGPGSSTCPTAQL